MTGNKDAEAGRCTQTLLACGHYYVDTPFVHLDQLACDGTDTVQDYLISPILVIKSQTWVGGRHTNVSGETFLTTIAIDSMSDKTAGREVNVVGGMRFGGTYPSTCPRG